MEGNVWRILTQAGQLDRRAAVPYVRAALFLSTRAHEEELHYRVPGAATIVKHSAQRIEARCL